MVQRSASIEIIKEFKDKINLKDAKFILFGSRAKGNFTKDSDFDLIIISKEFEGIPWYKRNAKIQVEWEYELPLEVLCFTPKEIKKLSKNTWGIVREALKKGIVIN